MKFTYWQPRYFIYNNKCVQKKCHIYDSSKNNKNPEHVDFRGLVKWDDRGLQNLKSENNRQILISSQPSKIKAWGLFWCYLLIIQNVNSC